MTDHEQPMTVTQSEAEWMMIMAAVVEAARSPTVQPEDRAAYAVAGRKLADKFPKASGPWFGGALFGVPDTPPDR